MQLENITVRYCQIGKFENALNDGVKHIKDLPYLSVVQPTQGWYSFGLNGQPQQRVDTGACFIAPALARQEITHHADLALGTMSARWLYLDILVNDHTAFDLAFTLPVFPNRELCGQTSALLDDIFAADNVIDRKIGCYRLLRLLLPCAAQKTSRDPRVETAIAFIRDNYRERLTVEEIAAAVSTSPPNLYRLFRQRLGTSPIEYCNTLRLSHACALLTQGGYSVQQVADICGVGDPYYFSKLFKKKYGVSPSCYK